MAKDVFARYAGQPWASVMASAENGADGLVVSWAENPATPIDHFALREARSAIYGPVPVACVFEQRW